MIDTLWCIKYQRHKLRSELTMLGRNYWFRLILTRKVCYGGGAMHAILNKVQFSCSILLSFMFYLGISLFLAHGLKNTRSNISNHDHGVSAAASALVDELLCFGWVARNVATISLYHGPTLENANLAVLELPLALAWTLMYLL